MRDPATAFPPLNKATFALFGLVPDPHGPLETEKMKYHQNRGPPAIATFTSHRISIYL